MSLPLEVRHTIFKHLSARESEPGKLLRYWFEKTEVKGLIAEHRVSNPSGPAPIAVYSNDDGDVESWSDTTEEEEQEAMDEEEDEEGEEDEDQNDQDGESEDEDEEDAYGGQESGDDDQSETSENYGSAENVSPRPSVRPQTKWRHIPNFMRLTHCPPPTELLLTSRQLNAEAKNWYYDMATLRINVTGGFAHTSFFEQALGQIADAVVSPLENVRKAELAFFWDSTWVRTRDTKGLVQAIFPALLWQRASFVYQALKQAPNLREVVIHWYAEAVNNQCVEQANLVPMQARLRPR